MLHKWSDYYNEKIYELDENCNQDWIDHVADDSIWHYYDRHNRISDITACCYKEIEIR